MNEGFSLVETRKQYELADPASSIRWATINNGGSFIIYREDTGATVLAIDKATSIVNITGSMTVNGSPVGAGGTQWVTSGSMIYYNAGNVGIGSSNPQYPLDILGYANSGWNGGGLRVYAGSGVNESGIHIQNTATSGRDYVIWSTGGASSLGVGNFVIGDATGSIHRLVINSSGNVGIGTANPQVLLDLPGYNTTNSQVRIGSMEFVPAVLNNSAITDNLYYNSAWIYRNTGVGTVIQNTSGNIVFWTAPSGTGGGTATITEQFRIGPSGLIKIANLPTVAPGAGSKQLWADPADGYRVKWAN